MLNKRDITVLEILLERVIKEQPTLAVEELEAGATLLVGIQRLIERREYYIPKAKRVVKNVR